MAVDKQFLRLRKKARFSIQMASLLCLADGITDDYYSRNIRIEERSNDVPHAPKRIHKLTAEEQKVESVLSPCASQCVVRVLTLLLWCAHSLLSRTHSDIFPRKSMQFLAQSS
jgi:hypothetical protein